MQDQGSSPLHISNGNFSAMWKTQIDISTEPVDTACASANKIMYNLCPFKCNKLKRNVYEEEDTWKIQLKS